MTGYKDYEHYGDCKKCKHVDSPRSVLSPCFVCSLREVFREGEWHDKWEPAEPERYCQDCAYYNIIDNCMPCQECKNNNLFVPNTEPIGPYYHYEKDLEKVTKEAWGRHQVRLAMLKGEANELTKQLEEMHKAREKHVKSHKVTDGFWFADCAEGKKAVHLLEPIQPKSLEEYIQEQIRKVLMAGIKLELKALGIKPESDLTS